MEINTANKSIHIFFSSALQRNYKNFKFVFKRV